MSNLSPFAAFTSSLSSAGNKPCNVFWLSNRKSDKHLPNARFVTLSILALIPVTKSIFARHGPHFIASKP
jgi:hypothetical protein